MRPRLLQPGLPAAGLPPPAPAQPRHAPDLPAARSRTTTGVYECDECGQRLAGERRWPDCNRYARRIGTGGACHACGEILTVDELLEAAID